MLTPIMFLALGVYNPAMDGSKLDSRSCANDFSWEKKYFSLLNLKRCNIAMDCFLSKGESLDKTYFGMEPSANDEPH